MKATHKEVRQMVGYQEVTLTPGQFVFGRIKASEETGLSVQTIRTCVDQLRKRQNLTIKSTNHYSIISIVNWGKYQEASTSQLTSNQPATNQQLTTNKNDKNAKKEKKVPKKDDFCVILPDSIDKDIWESFVGMRKEIKRPITNHAKGLLINKLNRLKNEGNAPNEVLEQSIINSWQGVFPIKGNSQPQPQEEELWTI